MAMDKQSILEKYDLVLRVNEYGPHLHGDKGLCFSYTVVPLPPGELAF